MQHTEHTPHVTLWGTKFKVYSVWYDMIILCLVFHLILYRYQMWIYLFDEFLIDIGNEHSFIVAAIVLNINIDIIVRSLWYTRSNLWLSLRLWLLSPQSIDSWECSGAPLNHYDRTIQGSSNWSLWIYSTIVNLLRINVDRAGGHFCCTSIVKEFSIYLF